MPVANVTTGDTLTEAWGDSVADSVNALEANVAGMLPAGVILPYGGASPPAGWLLCNGQLVSRTTYAALFAVLGTAYGAGDGTSTFGVPDLRQRFPMGVAASGTGSTRGAAGGNIDHTHTAGAHQHSSAAHTHTGAAHTHTSAAHQHRTPVMPGGGATVRFTGGGTFGTSADTYSATEEAVTSSSAATGPVNLTEDVTPGATGSTTPAAGGSTTPGDTGSAGGAATSSGNAPFQTVVYIIRT